MLIEFQISNFMSFREPAKLSMVKAAGDELSETNTFSPTAPSTPDLLRGTAVYGPNASGKSNLVHALRVMQRMVLRSVEEGQKGKPVPVIPFRLDAASRTRPSEFEIIFVNEGVRYQYGFAATAERILEEWLVAYPKGRPQRLIDRRYDEASDSDEWGGMAKLIGAKKVWQEATRPNALFLSTAIHLNNRQLAPVFGWFWKVLHIVGPDGLPPATSMTACEEAESRRKILAFLDAADIHIDDIEIQENRVEAKHFPPEMLDSLQHDKEDRYVTVKSPLALHRLENGETEYFEWGEESDGTKKLFEFAGPMLEALAGGHVVVIDELNNHLHPLLAEYLVRLFHLPETNTANAQLLLTTHDISLLDQRLLRRDQIWFCRQDRKQATHLYPLLDHSPRKGSENLAHGYLSGRYGATPYVKGVPLMREVSSG